jgi:hypothetical protein
MIAHHTEVCHFFLEAGAHTLKLGLFPHGISLPAHALPPAINNRSAAFQQSCAAAGCLPERDIFTKERASFYRMVCSHKADRAMSALSNQLVKKGQPQHVALDARVTFFYFGTPMLRLTITICCAVFLCDDHAVNQQDSWETVPGTGEVASFPAETLGTHKDGNTEHNVTSTGSPSKTAGVSRGVKGSRGTAAVML